MSSLFVREEGAGAPVLLIHGLGASHLDWIHQIPALARHYRVLALDLPGFGASPAQPVLKSLADYAIAVLAELDRRGVERLHGLAGHSMGGAIALEIALQAPQRVERLVLANTLVSFVPESLRQRLELGYRRWTARLFGMARLAELSAWRMFPRPDQAALREPIIARGRHNRVAPYLQALRAITGWDARPRLPGLRPPVLWLAAGQDYFRPEWVRRALLHLPRAEVQWFPEARHGLPMEDPEGVNAALLRFLATPVSA